MKSFLILLASLPLFALQDCRITILVDPVKENIRANNITNGAGSNIESDAGALTIDGLINTGSSPIDTTTVGLNLSPSITRQSVWRCDFQNSVNRQNLTVSYTLVALNGQTGRVSLGASSIPTTVRTKRLRFQRRGRVVTGDVEFLFDLSSPQMKHAGDYKGILTINVIEN